MSEPKLPRGRFRAQPYQSFLAAGLLMASGMVVSDSSALANKTVKAETPSPQVRSQQPKTVAPASTNKTVQATAPSPQVRSQQPKAAPTASANKTLQATAPSPQVRSQQPKAAPTASVKKTAQATTPSPQVRSQQPKTVAAAQANKTAQAAAPSPQVRSQQPKAAPTASANKTAQATTPSPQVRSQKPKALPERTPAVTPPAEVQSEDPMGSPYPIPWNWITKTYEQVSSTKGSGIRHYRTPAVISPDGNYAAYSRIQIQVKPELYHSNVSSVMFVENLQTGELRAVSATSPLANTAKANEAADQPGVISVMVPVSWSATGDRLLSRQFEGSLSASDASDYAVVWDRNSNRASTIAPNESLDYSNATLLGWSKTNPSKVIFRAGEMGDENPPLWAVAMNGQTVAAAGDQPVVFGRTTRYAWAGPQAY